MRIGAHTLRNGLFVAPMAGITDRPFRRLARRFGAALAVSEMVSARPELRESRKTRLRLDHAGEPGPVSVQIAGADPQMLAEAARLNVAGGAQIIDINMGCPAKKVCNRAAGSALMADEALALRIIAAVVDAVDVPVTVKMRTGTDRHQQNAPRLARAAERAGAAMITVHGRSRACGFGGSVDLDAIARVRDAISVPLVANGDVDSPQRAREVLSRTGADAVMIGRAAQGRPWLFAQVDRFLRTGELSPAPSPAEIGALLRAHLLDHYRFHGEWTGARTARKHIGWTLRALDAPEALRAAINDCDDPEEQLRLLGEFFDGIDDPRRASDRAVATGVPDKQPYPTEASAR